jgi:hypothetical protein
LHDSTSILNLILGSIFIGFGFVIPIIALLKTSNLKKLKFKELFILTAVQAVRIAGIIYFLRFVAEAAFYYKVNDNSWYLFLEVYSWLLPMIYLFLSQLLWIKKIYTNKIVLVLFSLLMLLSPLIYQTWFYLYYASILNEGEFIGISSLIETTYSLVGLVLNIIVFIFIIITIMLAGNKFKHIKQ